MLRRIEYSLIWYGLMAVNIKLVVNALKAFVKLETRFSFHNIQYYPPPGLIIPLFAGKRGTRVFRGEGGIVNI